MVTNKSSGAVCRVRPSQNGEDRRYGVTVMRIKRRYRDPHLMNGPSSETAGFSNLLGTRSPEVFAKCQLLSPTQDLTGKLL